MLAGDVGKIEDAFRRQTGVIEERTGTMERALSAGVDNVRQVLEKSAVVVAGALREKVLEVTSALTQEAGNAFSDADRRIAAARRDDVERPDGARRRNLQRLRPGRARAGKPRRRQCQGALHAPTRPPSSSRRVPKRRPALLSARAREIAGTFDEADQRLVARAAETASALASRAGDILRNFDDADQRLNSRIGEFGGSAGRARGRT